MYHYHVYKLEFNLVKNTILRQKNNFQRIFLYLSALKSIKKRTKDFWTGIQLVTSYRILPRQFHFFGFLTKCINLSPLCVAINNYIPG